MRLSVALCTYNGERFLQDQLISINGQTRLPDELVICDDASSDRSADIAEKFDQQVTYPVQVVINDKTHGSTRNFERAARLCTGDAIVFADQDDIWLPHKLAALETALTANPDAGFVFSDAAMVDEQLRPLGYTLWNSIRFWPREQERFRQGGAFEALLRRYRITGATMAFRANYRDLVLPIPTDWFHDAWIALLISAVAPCSLVSEPLIQYRQHDRQQLGGSKRGLYAQYLLARTRSRETFEAAAARFAAARERLHQLTDVKAEQLALLDEKVEHFSRRTAMRDPGVWRFPVVLREVWRGNYSRFSHGWKDIAQDLFLG